jgi:hypothetical protein
MARAATGELWTSQDMLKSLLDRDFKPRSPGAAEFERLLNQKPQSDFERLLQKEFVPASSPRGARAPKPPRKFVRGMGAGDDIIAIASIGAEILLFLAEAEERAAQKLGLTVEERRKMREDAFIAAELTKAAAEVVTQTLMDIEKEQLRKRTNVKRVRIHGYSRV